MSDEIVDSIDSNDALTPQDLVVEAVQYLQQGKRFMIMKDIPEAVPCFEEACKLFDLQFGKNALECGEAYMNYGISLFELSRLENPVFDKKSDSPASDDDDDNIDEGSDEAADQDSLAPIVEEEDNLKKDTNQTEIKADSSSNDEKIVTQSAEPSSNLASASNGHSSTTGDQPSTSSGVTLNGANQTENEEDDEENASNMEIAWEVLNMAKDIFTDQDTKESRLNLAETLQKLGEIALEWENNNQAVAFLNESLELRKGNLQQDDRLIAETYQFLGLAFSADLDKSNSCFHSALGIIQLRLDNLKNKNTDNLSQFDKDTINKEIHELEGLIPDIQVTIDELKESLQSQYKTKEMIETELKAEKKDEVPIKVSPDKPINNISHLIKRKREDDAEENKAESLKKACVEQTSNIEAASSSSNNTNGNDND